MVNLREIVEKELTNLNSAVEEEFKNPNDWFVMEGAKNALTWTLEQMDEFDEIIGRVKRW